MGNITNINRRHELVGALTIVRSNTSAIALLAATEGCITRNPSLGSYAMRALEEDISGPGVAVASSVVWWLLEKDLIAEVEAERVGRVYVLTAEGRRRGRRGANYLRSPAG